MTKAVAPETKGAALAMKAVASKSKGAALATKAVASMTKAAAPTSKAAASKVKTIEIFGEIGQETGGRAAKMRATAAALSLGVTRLV